MKQSDRLALLRQRAEYSHRVPASDEVLDYQALVQEFAVAPSPGVERHAYLCNLADLIVALVRTANARARITSKPYLMTLTPPRVA